MGGNFSKTRTLGSWTAPPTATGSREEELGLETVTTLLLSQEQLCMDGYFHPEVRAALGRGFKGSLLKGSAGMCCCLTRLFPMGCMLDTSPGRLWSEMRK